MNGWRSEASSAWPREVTSNTRCCRLVLLSTYFTTGVRSAFSIRAPAVLAESAESAVCGRYTEGHKCIVKSEVVAKLTNSGKSTDPSPGEEV